MKKVGMKYIISVISLLLVTALVVLAPYGYNYINDNISEGKIHNDGTFLYSEGKIATEYDEVQLLLEKSSPVWINENIGTLTAEMYDEISSAMGSFLDAMKDEHIENMFGSVLHIADTNNCDCYKVSGVVGNEPFTLNLMSVDFIKSYDYSVAEISFVYNRDNKKVYEIGINLGDESASNEYEGDIDSLKYKYLEYLGCSAAKFSGEVFADYSTLYMCAFPDIYLNKNYSVSEKNMYTDA